MKLKPDIFLVRILIQVIYPFCIEKARPSLDPMHHIALLQEKFSQISSILACDAGN
jgi:hypothetical protein